MNGSFRSTNHQDKQQIIRSRQGSNIIHGTTSARSNYGADNGSLTGRKIFYEDPAAILNMSDNAWNEQVQKQAREHKEKAQAEIQKKLERNKLIMEEQKRQIDEKRNMRS